MRNEIPDFVGRDSKSSSCLHLSQRERKTSNPRSDELKISQGNEDGQITRLSWVAEWLVAAAKAEL